MKTLKKLTLNRETVRALDEADLRLVAGGLNYAAHRDNLKIQPPTPTLMCPCGSSITDGGFGGTAAGPQFALAMSETPGPVPAAERQ